MAFVFITLGMIVLYFIISSIKEGETKRAIDQERKKSLKREANIHFNNMIENEIVRQNNIKKSREIFVTQLEKSQGIKKASIDENTLTIITDYKISMIEADDYARMWINNLIPETEINVVKVFDSDGFISAVAERTLSEE